MAKSYVGEPIVATISLSSIVLAGHIAGESWRIVGSNICVSP